jgi:large subunit ribosomal protein L13
VEKTYVKKGQPESNWVLIDAEGQTLGRLATKIAAILMGKHKPVFTPGVALGDSVIVINAKGIQANPTRVKEKIYYRHSNYPGGLKAVSYPDQLANHPDRIIKAAVKGMLPHNRYGSQLMKRLRVFAGAEHPHVGQQPKKFD